MSLPKTIKAIQAPRHGEVDVIEMADIAFPEQKSNEVLIKVNYAGVNFLDTQIRKGRFPSSSFPFRLGHEGAGTIIKLPSDLESLGHTEYKKRGFVQGGKVVWLATTAGSFGEYVSVPWDAVIPIPSSISPRDACSIFAQGLTAIAFMTESHNVQAGETVLIHAVAGGLGLIFAQIAKGRGAAVIGTTSARAKAEIAEKNGADHVILYTEEDTVKRVLEITNGEGVHAIFDSVGKDTFDKDFDMIRRKGSIVCVGSASGVIPPFAPSKLLPKNIKLSQPTLFKYVVTPEEFGYYSRELLKLVEDGTVKVNIFKEYPFTAEGVQQAQTDMLGRSTTGKLVVKIAN